jgi:hypothetical protein
VTFSRGCDTAERALADPRTESVRGEGGVLNLPVALTRATTALLRGDAKQAQTLAEVAIAAYAAGERSPRQHPWVMMGTAFAHALAGRTDEAARLGHEAMTRQVVYDAFDASKQRNALGQLFILCGRPDDAFEQLRLMMTQPCEFGTEQVQLDPIWQRLRGDSRFEQMLKLARPL